MIPESPNFNYGEYVKVTSTNNFALKAEGIDRTISYFHATGQNDTAATTTFEFTAAEINAGTSKDVGGNVADYSSAANGTYEDEITYSVKVENAEVTLTSLVYLDVSGTSITTLNADGCTNLSALNCSNCGIDDMFGQLDVLKCENQVVYGPAIGRVIDLSQYFAEISASGYVYHESGIESESESGIENVINLRI